MKPTLTTTPTFQPGDFVAVGDVHGRIDLLWKLIEKLRGTQVHLLFLGDLIDRARRPEDDMFVLNVVKGLREDPETFGLASVDALRGNHEDMFLAAVDDNTPWQNHITLWAQNGGAVGQLQVMKVHADWLREAPYYKVVDKTIFVHAGLRPNVPLSEQRTEDLIWIREPFLRVRDFNVEGIDFVVHGHTPNFAGEFVLEGNRLDIDTGAYLTGVLTAYNHRSSEVFQVGNQGG
jgi:serine/threonine protein phosphatase 1